MMAIVKTGTVLHVKGSHLDDYVIERITKCPAPGGGTVVRIEARTVRQRCFDRQLTGYTTWDGAYVRDCLKAGSMSLENVSTP